ncbi:MAG: PQQ-binding-like beta-propeller repeat protein [Planctomycetota bacterium]
MKTTATALGLSLVLGCTAPPTLQVIDSRDGALRFEAPGTADHLAADAAAGLVWINAEGTVRALRLATGEEQWQLRGRATSTSPLLVAGPRLVFRGIDGALVAVDAASGAAGWERAGAGGRPLHALGQSTAGVFGVDGAGQLWVIDPASGEPRHAAQPVAASGSSVHHVAVQDGVAACQTYGGQVRRVDLAGGSAPPPQAGATAIPPLLHGDRLLFVDRDGCVRLGADTAAPTWSLCIPSGVASLAAAGDLIYAGARRGELRAIDATSGAVRWALDTDGTEVRIEPHSDMVLVATNHDGVYAADARTGEVRWHVTMAARIRAFAKVGDLVVVRHADGAVWAIDAASGTVRWTRALRAGRADRVLLLDAARQQAAIL